MKNYKVTISSKLENIDEAVQPVLKNARKVGFSDSRVTELQLALHEALTNAVKHGNKLDKSKKVLLEWEQEDHGVKISIEDEGGGFNPANITNPMAPENIMKEGGRGIHFIKQLFKEVQFNEKGNRISFVILK